MTVPQRSVRLSSYHSTILSEGAYIDGEIFYDQDLKTLRLFDGKTNGGYQLLRADLTNLQQAELNKSLDLGTGSLTAAKLIFDHSIANASHTGALSYGTLTYTDTNIIASLQSNTAGSSQIVLQNSSAGTTANANYLVSNNLGTSTTYHGEFGMNSSTFVGSSSFGIPSAVYLASASSDLTIGSYGNHAIHFVVNNNPVDSVTITNDNRVLINGSLTVSVNATIDAALEVNSTLTVNDDVDVDGNITATQNFVTGHESDVRFRSSDSKYVGFKAASTLSDNVIWTLPSIDGLHKQVLITDGNGVLSWVSPAQIGGNYFNSTFYDTPGTLDNFDYGSGETFVAETRDAFGVSCIEQFDMMDPVASYQTFDYGTLT